ncbi:Uu.00g122000.m01.CDS01 [Anthostomella pinea]|uniref:Uu.00g122000.m01.CDS01 n=1 Tax=Anthostomella pinea TaxID=933095 RepID=A0AAI8VHM5_9PEZI|nr:Uu.00g122000.m01.CDS01 [Anthostomella pinea]
MATSEDTSPGLTANDPTSDGVQLEERGISRLLRRRTPTTRQNARDTSVGSLDRIFDTRTQSGGQRLHDAPPSLTSGEQYFIDNTYGVNELRDSFFDAIFLPPEDVDAQDLMAQAETTLPYALRKQDPLSLSNFLPKQWHEVKGVIRRVTTTRAGIKLAKSFLGFFIAYVLCLVPLVRARLGRHSYIMVISAIINHPGRTLGAQVDGTILTIVGSATGLAWGSFGLWVSTVTATARVGYGGVLATFLFLYIFVIACLRSYYIRTYQLIICAGIAISYTCLAEVSGSQVSWSKLLEYGIPWLLGQAISLFICCMVAPDAGARPLAVALHQTFGVMLTGLESTTPDSTQRRRSLTQAFVGMSQAYRDFVIDFSITLFDPKDVKELRNLIQAVIRALLSLKTETKLFDPVASAPMDPAGHNSSGIDGFVVDMDAKRSTPKNAVEEELLKFVISNLAEPTEDLLLAMKAALQSCDAVLMEMCGHRQYLGPSDDVSNDVPGSLVKLRQRIIEFSTCQDSVLASDKLPPTYSDFPEVVKTFAFCRPIHQAATSIEALLVKVNHMQQRRPEYPKFHLPNYPFWKALHRSNAQVRHDRGGVTAGSYFRSFSDIAELIQKIKALDFHPLPQKDGVASGNHDTSFATMTAKELEDDPDTKKSRIRQKFWAISHRFQGFETRFGLKTAAITSLLAVPAWLSGSDWWWDRYEVWWAVVMAWMIMGPRTGGNVQDLFTRALCGVLGALWGGLSYAAGNGNPYVIAVFAAVFMLPMIYRFTQSTHPRSGIVGCISFTVVSLSEVTAEGQPSPATIAATRGAAIVVGVTASIIVNWIIWPFVARHDLRKATASMLFYCSIIYRSIVSRYIYYDGQEPTKEDIEASEVLEGRLREGFVRLRQLMVSSEVSWIEDKALTCVQGLTRHEIRLRAPFDPVPYSALINSCERFFEYIVTVRQSSLFYHPHFIRDNAEAAADLLGHRRDAIATILTNLYVLSGALRANRKVPKYLASAAATRKRLMDKMRELENELLADSGKLSAEEKVEDKKWAQIYSYSYNESLTGCVEQLEELEKYTKAVVGEQGQVKAIPCWGDDY